jgi:hypothetical protein
MKTIDRPAITAIAAVAALLLEGCASMRLAARQDDYMRETLGSWVYPKTCKDVWPDVVKLLASKGFSLAGDDRVVAGEAPQSAFIAAISEGFATRQSYDGGLVLGTSWNRNWVRYRAIGAVVGSGCSVSFLRDVQPDTDDPGKVESTTDYEMALDLLRRVDPAGAARVEAGMPRSAS